MLALGGRDPIANAEPTYRTANSGNSSGDFVARYARERDPGTQDALVDRNVV